MDEAEHFAGEFVDDIVLRQFRGQQCDIALELGAHGLEATRFELEEAGALQEAIASDEAVTAIDRMIGKIRCQSEAEKHNERASDHPSTIMVGLTQHSFLFVRYAR